MFSLPDDTALACFFCRPVLTHGPLQDDGHIFCLPDQIADEIRNTLDLVENVMGAFGFSKLEVNLSTRPEKAVGSDAIWERSEIALREALAAKVRGARPLAGRTSCSVCTSGRLRPAVASVSFLGCSGGDLGSPDKRCS